MQRREIAIQGLVQGVGFRPFVHGLAARHRLAGFVRNLSGGVLIEVEGAGVSLDQFLRELAGHPPPLARIESLSWQTRPPRGDDAFRILASDNAEPGPVFIAADAAVCPECLAELRDPTERRYRYPFLNCTHCGPRLTIVTGAPYDRERTTMSAFPMCPACRAEYDDPANRRFHAQPTACPACGPKLTLRAPAGAELASSDPLRDFVAALHAGKIGLLKGLGGYHLACNARNEQVVQELRRRKQRDEKPFAVMVRDRSAARALCDISPEEGALLESSARPIVLLRRLAQADIAHAVAPGNPWLGLMLPYTPLHHLLMDELGDSPLVLTSGNRSDEPIAYEDDDACARLAAVCDVALTHNRPIHVRCDDSVTRVLDGQEAPVRRSRGYAPLPVRLPNACSQPILAVGGQFKGTFGLGRGEYAFLSHHLGDLDHYDAYRAFEKDIDLYQELFDIEPELIVHDLHPDYASTRYAQQRGGRLLAVQHHHAHLASCLTENGVTEPAIGVIFDGTGYGSDGTIWGGEFLVGDCGQFRRAGHLRPVGMPGGAQAIREPWRMALAHLVDAGVSGELLATRISRNELRTVATMLDRGFNTPLTSSAGRLFDAVASLIGVRDRASYEGQAAIELEWLAQASSAEGPYPIGLEVAADSAALIVDTRPLIRSVAKDVQGCVSSAVVALRFHASLVELIVRVCRRLRSTTGLEVVALGGGVFMNTLLANGVRDRLVGEDFRVLTHRLVPPNDGGLSLGQLAVGAAFLSRS